MGFRGVEIGTILGPTGSVLVNFDMSYSEYREGWTKGST